MGFTVIRNTQGGIPYTQYGTDAEKKRALAFVNKDDKQITKLAYNMSGQRRSDRNFNNKIAGTFMALPMIGGAAATTLAKGSLSKKMIAGAKGFTKTGVGIAVPLGVVAADGIMTMKSDKLKKAEEKHPILTLAGMIAASSVLYDGAEALAHKVAPKAKDIATGIGKKAGLDKLAEHINNIPNRVGIIASDLHLGKGIAAIKKSVPASVKEVGKKIVNADITKNITAGAKTLGKVALKNPVTTILGAMLIATIGHDIKKHKTVSAQKEVLRNAQNKTANRLIDAYAKENDSLKEANSQVAVAIDATVEAGI